jgi:DNA-binding CsgD family transcriptional regulator
MRPGELLVCHDHFDQHYVARSEFYQDFYLTKAGGRYVAGTRLADTGDLAAIIGLHRNDPSRLFTRADQERIQVVLPHLARAVKIHSRIDRLRAKHQLGMAALDKLPTALLLVDTNGVILLANAAASELLRRGDGVFSVGGHLVARQPDDNRALQNACRRAGGVRISREAANPLQCLVALLSADGAAMFGHARSAALVLISDPDVREAPSAADIAKAYDLSPAEARVAEAVARGKSLAMIAQELGVSRNTVRNQTQSVLTKTGAQRQADLVRLVGSLPITRSDSSEAS